MRCWPPIRSAAPGRRLQRRRGFPRPAAPAGGASRPLAGTDAGGDVRGSRAASGLGKLGRTLRPHLPRPGGPVPGAEHRCASGPRWRKPRSRRPPRPLRRVRGGTGAGRRPADRPSPRRSGRNPAAATAARRGAARAGGDAGGSRLGQGWLLRPLLDVDRADLLVYAQAHELRWIEDASNADPGFDRNYLRHRILPLLRERWPAVTQNLARSARWCAETADWLDAEAAADLARVGTERPDGLHHPGAARTERTPPAQRVAALLAEGIGSPCPITGN